MVYDIIPYCSLVAVVFKDTALVVNPLFQLHAKGIQWNLRIKDTLGAEVLSSFRRLSSGGRFEPIGHL